MTNSKPITPGTFHQHEPGMTRRYCVICYKLAAHYHPGGWRNPHDVRMGYPGDTLRAQDELRELLSKIKTGMSYDDLISGGDREGVNEAVAAIETYLAAHDNTLYQRVVDEVIGPDVVPNMHPGLLQTNQDAQNRLRKVQRQRVARIFRKGE